jgi:hypothetical protein
MLIYDKLDQVAEEYIPNEIHPYLHVQCRQAWVDIMFMMIDYKHFKPNEYNIHTLAEHWEDVLYRRYAPLN